MVVAAARTFADFKAIRERTPLIIGLTGPSGAGKTMSALELAAGIRRVVGGETYFVDTESRRALAYADRYDFRHVPFAAPFSPLDYLAALEHCAGKGASTVVIDSMSHEHEGPGGVLEMHENEIRRKAGDDVEKAERVKIGAWALPKAQRQRLINTMLQLPCNVIMCFRAKEKLKVVTGQKPVVLGWQPIAGDEFIYECSLHCLLYPGCDGVPEWQPAEVGEKRMVKLPGQFREILTKGTRLSEDVGEKLARWAAGAPNLTVAELLEQYSKVADAAGRAQLERARRAVWDTCSEDQKTALKAATNAAAARIAAASTTTATTSTSTSTSTASPATSPASDDEPPPDLKLAWSEKKEP